MTRKHCLALGLIYLTFALCAFPQTGQDRAKLNAFQNALKKKGLRIGEISCQITAGSARRDSLTTSDMYALCKLRG